MKLENWSVITRGERTSLLGNVFGHSNPRHEDGKSVVTSRVVSVDGRKITTRSGSVYTLGKISPEYREYIKRTRPEWDWRNPIKMAES